MQKQKKRCVYTHTHAHTHAARDNNCKCIDQEYTYQPSNTAQNTPHMPRGQLTKRASDTGSTLAYAGVALTLAILVIGILWVVSYVKEARKQTQMSIREGCIACARASPERVKTFALAAVALGVVGIGMGSWASMHATRRRHRHDDAHARVKLRLDSLRLAVDESPLLATAAMPNTAQRVGGGGAGGRVPLHCRALVCADGRASTRVKLALVRSARVSIVASLNYGGGTCFAEFLDALKERLDAGVCACILASATFMSKADVERVRELVNVYSPSRLWFQWADKASELSATGGVDTTTIRLSSNHTKLLCIDGGVAIVIGGTGVQDAYVCDGMESGAERDSSTTTMSGFMPTSFRDMDWCLLNYGARGWALTRHLVHLATRWQVLERNDDSDDDESGHPDTASPRTANAIDAHARDAWLTTFSRVHKTQTPLDGDSASSLVSAAAAASIHTAAKLVHVQSAQWYETGPSCVNLATRAGAERCTEFHTRIVHALARAKRRIVIAHMFIHPTREVVDSIVKALHSGVDVTLVTNGHVEGRTPGTHGVFVPRSRDAYARIYDAVEPSARDNFRVYEFTRGAVGCTYHKKCILIDDYVWMGNSNLGCKSLTLGADYEVNMCIQSKELTRDTERVIRDDIERGCTQVDLARPIPKITPTLLATAAIEGIAGNLDGVDDRPSGARGAITHAGMNWLHTNVLESLLG